MKIKLDTILCETKINQIKHAWLRTYCLQFLCLKNLLLRFGSFIFIALISCLLFFILRNEALVNGSNYVQFNIGFAWGFGDDWDQGIVYFLKILPTVIFFILFFCFHQWYLYLPLSLIAINSLLNIIDKGLVDVFFEVEYFDAVVDYFYWPAFGFTNNIADILIIAGSVLTIIGLVVLIYFEYKQNAKEKAVEHDQTPSA